MRGDAQASPFWKVQIIGLPFLFHGIYGVYISWQAKNNPRRCSTGKNWQFALQRWTAWLLVRFLFDHVPFFRFLMRLWDIPLNYGFMQHSVQDPVYFTVYLLGMLAAIFHFCNGITTFSMSWGITVGPRSQRTLNLCSMVLAAGLSLLVAGTLLSYCAG